MIVQWQCSHWCRAGFLNRRTTREKCLAHANVKQCCLGNVSIRTLLAWKFKGSASLTACVDVEQNDRFQFIPMEVELHVHKRAGNSTSIGRTENGPSLCSAHPALLTPCQWIGTALMAKTWRVWRKEKWTRRIDNSNVNGLNNFFLFCLTTTTQSQHVCMHADHGINNIKCHFNALHSSLNCSYPEYSEKPKLTQLVAAYKQSAARITEMEIQIFFIHSFLRFNRQSVVFFCIWI